MRTFTLEHYNYGYAVRLPETTGRMCIDVTKVFAKYINRIAKKIGSTAYVTVEKFDLKSFERIVCKGRDMNDGRKTYKAFCITYPEKNEMCVRYYAPHHLFWMVGFYTYQLKKSISTEEEFEQFVKDMLLTYDNKFDWQ